MTDTRDRLLAGTRVCIRRRGLAATTSREITAEAGVNLAAITYHFGSKEQLVAEALLGGLRTWLAPALAVLRSDADPAARTTRAMATLVSIFNDMREEAPTYLEALVHASRVPALNAGVVELWDELRTGLAEQMEAMKHDGSLPVWVEPAAMASLFIAVANGLVLQVTLEPDGPELGDMAAQFARMLLSAGGSSG